MTMLRKACGSAVIASMLAASATPALARPGYGWGGRGYGDHWHHHDGDGFGNFLLGAIVAGGAIALVSSASNAQHERDGVRYGTSDYDDGRIEVGQDPRSWSDAEMPLPTPAPTASKRSRHAAATIRKSMTFAQSTPIVTAIASRASWRAGGPSSAA